MPMQASPACRADSIPHRESSIATHSAGGRRVQLRRAEVRIRRGLARGRVAGRDDEAEVPAEARSVAARIRSRARSAPDAMPSGNVAASRRTQAAAPGNSISACASSASKTLALAARSALDLRRRPARRPRSSASAANTPAIVEAQVAREVLGARQIRRRAARGPAGTTGGGEPRVGEHAVEVEDDGEVIIGERSMRRGQPLARRGSAAAADSRAAAPGSRSRS